MALIKCTECGKEISDKADSCIHCGNPLAASLLSSQRVASIHLQPQSVDQTVPQKSETIESKARTAVDIIFSLIYLFLIYVTFTDLKATESGAAMFGAFLAFVIVIFIHKAIRFVVGSIAKSAENVLK